MDDSESCLQVDMSSTQLETTLMWMRVDDGFLDTILNNAPLTTQHIHYFSVLVQRFTNLVPVLDSSMQLNGRFVNRWPGDEITVQILLVPANVHLKLSEHYICSYYDTRQIMIFDPLSPTIDLAEYTGYLRANYPIYFSDTLEIVFSQAHQFGAVADSGVYAIAFSISLLMGIDPRKIEYRKIGMREHLLKLILEECLEHFPYSFSPSRVVSESFVFLQLRNLFLLAAENEAMDDLDLDEGGFQTGDFDDCQFGVENLVGRVKPQNPPILIETENSYDGFNKMWLQGMEPRAFQEILVSRDDCLFNNHIYYFDRVVHKITGLAPIPDEKLQFPDIYLEPWPADEVNIQIVYIPMDYNEKIAGHFVCCYYDTRSIFVFDSLRSSDGLHPAVSAFLRARFPYYFEKNKQVFVPHVHRQQNGIDCGVFSIAFATSLLFGTDPRTFEYDTKSMRQHLSNMFLNQNIQPFPGKFSNHRVQQIMHDDIFLRNVVLYGTKDPLMELVDLNIQEKGGSTEAEHSLMYARNESMQNPDPLVQLPVKKELPAEARIPILKPLSGKSIELIEENVISLQAPRIETGGKRKRSRKSRTTILTLAQRKRLTTGACLQDIHIDKFHEIVRTNSNFLPQCHLLIQNPHRITPARLDCYHIQILFSNLSSTVKENLRESCIGHWVCAYYDKNTATIVIYDSLRMPGSNQSLHPMQREFLERLFPDLKEDKISLRFPSSQQQSNGTDCGVYAIAFATSLFFNRKPENIHYDPSKMRKHLLEMFNTNRLSHFPVLSPPQQQNISKSLCVSSIRKILKIPGAKGQGVKKMEVPCSHDSHNICAEAENLQEEKKLAGLKSRVAKSIKKKYSRQASKMNTFGLLQAQETYILSICDKVLGDTDVERRVLASQIISTCIYSRDAIVRQMYCSFAKLKKLLMLSLCRIENTAENDVEAVYAGLCGKDEHSSGTEPFFSDATYDFSNFRQVNENNEHYDNFVEESANNVWHINKGGLVTNILPLLPVKDKNQKIWQCDRRFCKLTDLDLISELRDFFKFIIGVPLRDVAPKITGSRICTCETRNPAKLGHPISCYVRPISCRSAFLRLHILATHYPHLRNIKSVMYELERLHEKVKTIDRAFEEADLQELLRIERDSGLSYIHQDNPNTTAQMCNETLIREKFKKAVAAYTKISMDPPKYPCVCCEKLICKREVSKVKTDRFTTDVWKKLIDSFLERQYPDGAPEDSEELEIFVCRTCAKNVKDNVVSSMCVLNNLEVQETPEEIKRLNSYAKILIQRAKCFQTVQKCTSVMKKNLPHYVKIDKVIGRAFHLPLPLQETLNKLQSSDRPVLDPEFFILRNIPTGKGIIWESLVDVHNLWDALSWLKINNPLYSEIILPKRCNSTEILEGLPPIDFQFQETDEEQDLEEEQEDIPNPDIPNEQKTDGNIFPDQPAMLTLKSPSDPFYDHYTICCVYEKKINASNTDLYQMKKIIAGIVDSRAKDLDLKCFPDLFPFGKNGQGAERPKKMRDYDFIRSRLMSKHSQFRLNIQYLFYLLNDSNLRQLNAGIFTKLTVVNPKNAVTAGALLDNLKTEQLETTLNTIFGRIRNTEQYWSKVKNDLRCMIHHYGPATWFITISPGEWMWSDLGAYLREVNGLAVDKKSISELIAFDPVSTSRFMKNKFDAFLAYILSDDNPIGPVEHYYWRLEYQERGLQHYHLLIWIKDAPVIGKSHVVDVEKFILQHATCQIPLKTAPELLRRVNSYQIHKHNRYCQRKKKTKVGFAVRCRFSFPRKVTDRFTLRDVAMSITARKKLKRNSRLYDLPRRPHETFVNDYFPSILAIHEGNTDATFIGEMSHLLTHYCIKYTTKTEKSVLDFESINTNKSLMSRLFSLGLRALNHRQCGALEAADTLLGHPLYGTDRDTSVVWVDVRRIRNRKLKPVSVIKALPEDSTDIFYDSLVDTLYPQRPSHLDNLCLYDFVRWFNYYNTKLKTEKPDDFSIGEKYFRKRSIPHLINHWKSNHITEPENHYFTLLFLFEPWRDTDTLLGKWKTYAEAFENKSMGLLEAMKYHDQCLIIQEAERIMREQIERETSNDDPKNIESLPGNVPEGCVPVETENVMKEYVDMACQNVNNSKQTSLKEDIAKLNQDQRRNFDYVTGIIKTGGKVLRRFISGSGGSGKSFLIQTLVKWCREEMQMDVAVIAPTGIAAFNVNGQTIHRFFQLKVEQGQTASYKPLSGPALQLIRQVLKNTTLIIIDEISMVSNVIFLYIHQRLVEIFDTHDDEDGWFGNKHILVFGDLLQLPPVRAQFVFQELTPHEIQKLVGGMISSNIFRDLFDYDELTINMRQKDDEEYCQMLARIRLGVVTETDVRKLLERKIEFKKPDAIGRLNELCDLIQTLPEDTVCLLPTNEKCNTLNETMLGRLPSDEISLVAVDSFAVPSRLNKKRIEKLIDKDADEDNPSKSGGVARKIVIKIGARVMIRRNIDVSLGLVNGAIGIVNNITRDPKTDRVLKVHIAMANHSVYPIEPAQIKYEILDGVFVVREQFPISLSYGLTIHKSQGLSLQHVVADLGESIFSDAQSYVALSRVTKMQGLTLINLDPQKIAASTSAILEYNRLKGINSRDLHSVPLKNRVSPKHISDDVWCVHNNDTISKLQSENHLPGTVRALPDLDQVSSYANVIILALFFTNKINNVIRNLRNNYLSNMLANYSNNVEISAAKFRDFVDSTVFGVNRQQDPSKFLESVVLKFPELARVIKHDAIFTRRCLCCDWRTEETHSGAILRLIPPNDRKTAITLEELFESNVDSWVDHAGVHCIKCQKQTNHSERTQLRAPKSVLIVQLDIFKGSDDSTTAMKIKDLKINGISTAIVKINGISYRVSNAIFHEGDICSGHYTNVIRREKSWTRINTSTCSKIKWPRGSKGLYLIFLEKIGE